MVENNLIKCIDTNKYKGCKCCVDGKCVALERNNFPYDCPFYTEVKRRDNFIKDEDFTNKSAIDFINWLLEQRLEQRVVGYLSTGEKYDLTRHFLKLVKHKLEKLEEIENGDKN